MRYQSVLGTNDDRLIEISASEMLVHEFYLKETDGKDSWDLMQTINLMNVSYTAKMDKFLGSYGP